MCNNDIFLEQNQELSKKFTQPNWLIPNFENIPDDLKLQPWAVWIAEPRSDKVGKYNKAPRSPLTGIKIGTNQAQLFGTFDQAKTAYETGNYTGVGVLITGTGIVGFEIDFIKVLIQLKAI